MTGCRTEGRAGCGEELVLSWEDLNLRSVRELETTNTEEKPIAMPANPGLRKPIAATGISTTL